MSTQTSARPRPAGGRGDTSGRAAVSSSFGPRTARRSSRFSSEMRRAAAVISRTGRSARPATHHPRATDTTVMTARATSEERNSSWDSCPPPGCPFACDCNAWTWPCSCWMRAWAWPRVVDDGPLPGAGTAALLVERTTRTPLAMASSSTPHTTNKSPYSAVRRTRTVRPGSRNRPDPFTEPGRLVRSAIRHSMRRCT